MAEPGYERGLTAVAGAASAERAVFAEFLAAAEEAERAGGGMAADLVVGSSVVRVRFAGAAYAEPVLHALGHLASPGAVPDSTIVVWDTASTGVSPPRFPWTHQSHGQPVGFDHPDLRTVFAPDPGGVTMFDTVTRTGVVWAPSARELKWWEHAAPIRAALYYATVRPGEHLVHAGAVGAGGRGVLLAGRGGSGKSTLALVCVEAGMDYAGDDYVLVTNSPEPVAHCVYRTAKVDPASFEFVPGMREAVQLQPAAPGDKAVLDVARHRPDRMASSLSLAAVLHPRITGANPPVLRRVSGRDALMTLVPSTVFQLPGEGDSAMATLSELVRRTPTYVLETGPDIEASVKCIARLVEPA